MSHSENLDALPTIQEVVESIPTGRLPYIAAQVALTEIVTLRVEAAYPCDVGGQYADHLRQAIDEIAKHHEEHALEPPLNPLLAGVVKQFSCTLRQNDIAQSERSKTSRVNPHGFYDLATNRYDHEAMLAGELLLAAVVDHGRSGPVEVANE